MRSNIGEISTTFFHGSLISCIQIIIIVDDMQEDKDKQVKNYDFKRPVKFSKEHLRTLEIIYEHYG